MDSSSTTSLDSNSGTGIRAEQRPFKIDHTSLLQAKSLGRQINSKSPNREPETKINRLSSSPDWRYKGLANTAWDRVGFLKGALGDNQNSNGLGAEGYKPLDRPLQIDRTQSLMTATGYSSVVGSSYRPLHRELNVDRTRSSMTESVTSTSSIASENSLPKTPPKPSFTPTALTRSASSDKTEGHHPQQRGFKGSHSSLVRAGSSTPMGGLRSPTPVGGFKSEAPDEKESQEKMGKPSRRSSSSSSSSEEEEEEEEEPEPPPPRKNIKSPFSYTDRSGSTTPYSTGSRTPATSPLPKKVLENHSPTNRNYYTPVKAETQQRDPEKTSAIFGLKTALDLAQRKSAEDKKTIEGFKNQLIACKEEKAKEDPILKAALEDALRELRENKEVIAALNRDINGLKKRNENLKEETESLGGNLQELESDRSQDISNYRSRVVALEEENLILTKEKDDINEKLAVISSKLEAQENELLKDKEQLETSIRSMQEKVTDSQRDKLYAAIKTEDVDAIESLLLSPIDLDAVITPDDSNRRAIHLAAENIKLASVVNELIEAKVDVNVIDSDGETALHIAARSGRGRIVKALLEAKADWNIINIEGWTAVQVAAAVGNLSALDEFRKYDSAALKTKDEEGSTLLHYTSANSQKKATQWLVRHGSSKKRRDAFGLVAKDYKEAAKGDEGLLACFGGGGGKKMAQEQLPRLQLQSGGSFRRSRASSRSLPEKTLSDTDVSSSHATISEKQFVVSNETDTELCHEEENYPKSVSEAPTPVPLAEIKPDITIHTQEGLKGKLSLVGSDSGRSSFSLDTSSAIHRPPKTPPPSEMSRVSLPGDESLSEDQCSDVSMISSQRSFKERLPTGLPNLGNTGYMNAILQCLYYTKPLSDNFINSRYRNNINKRSDYKGAAAVAFGNCVKALRTGKQTYASVKNMKDTSGRCDRYYADDDTKEPIHFLQQLLLWLHQDLSKNVSPDEILIQGQVSLISTLFFGVHLCTVVCQESGAELNKTEEEFSSLSLPVEISGPTELQDLLAKSYKPQLILWACSECGKDHMCLKKQKILRLPSHLVIHFDRNEEINGNLMAAKNRLTYPQDDLSLADYVVEARSDRGTYELYAVCNQKGHGVTSHHTACCMTASPPVWCLFNDLTVKPIATEETVQQPDAHILFYKMSVASFHSTGV